MEARKIPATFAEFIEVIFTHFCIDNKPFGLKEKGVGCAYRANSETCCAFGLFMSDTLARELDNIGDSSISEVFRMCNYDPETVDNYELTDVMPELHEFCLNLRSMRSLVDTRDFEQIQMAHDRAAMLSDKGVARMLFAHKLRTMLAFHEPNSLLLTRITGYINDCDASVLLC